MAALANQNGAGPSLRLDPYQAPHRVSLGEVSYKIDTHGAVVKKTLTCGLPISMAVPARAFKGVAARAREDEIGKISVSLELHHHDPELCVPLLYANDMDDIAADWHSWSRLMNLPMLIIDESNVASAIRQQLGELMIEAPWERRKRITTPKHRPNFLRRRKQGVIGEVVRISAAEIIARR